MRLEFRSRRRAGPAVSAGERIYAIGDVHGRYDLLRQLLTRIEQHSVALPPPRSEHVICLGDMIDRGPESDRVLEFFYNADQASDQVIVLGGNHEELMLKALEGSQQALRVWLKMGGRETLQSFGVTLPDDPHAVQDLLPEVIARIPPKWIEWLRGLPVTARSGDYFFCHAGVRPGVALNRQQRSDLLWIREEFLDNERDHGAIVVHGHSVSTDVEMRDNRIGIDTGAYRTGVLTALYLEGTTRETISTAQGVENMMMGESLNRA